MTVRTHPARVPVVLSVALALAVAGSPGLTAAASAAETSGLVIEGGVTQPVHGYADAVRETVMVAGAVSSHDGDEVDELMVDIIRPAASEESLAVPTIVIPSPYYEEAWGVGRAREFKPDPHGLLDHLPQYYDNYFVPRGYAVALVDLAGTRGSTGCPDAGGPAEIDNTVKVIEWLAGADGARGYDLEGIPVAADWSNGRSAILGASWNGAVANGVAARGVDGLATIVPIAAISTWHAYHWSNGVPLGLTPLGLSDGVRSVPEEQCRQTRDLLADGGEDPEPTTPFWSERDYVRDAHRVQASVFVQHGLNDYNVKPVHLDRWWAALAEHDVPRKIWLAQTEHARAFDFRREEWVATIHRWFDHWLHGIDNGIMDEPMADVEHAPDAWTTYEDWPAGTSTTLRPGQPEDDDPRAGVLSLDRRDLQPRAQTFTETHQPLDQAAGDGFDDERADRLVFMTDELTAPVRLSGASRVSLRASIDGPDASLSAYLVDYGEATRTDWTQDTGLRDLTTTTCFGEGTAADTGCYPAIERRTRTRPFEVVARGWANASFLTGADTFDPDQSHRLTWEIMTDDYVFEAGHRIGIVLSGIGQGARAPHTASDITVHLNGSHVQLPIVGGPPALRAATR